MKKFCLIICLFVCTVASATTKKTKTETPLTYCTVENLPYRSSGSEYAMERCKLDVYYPENVKDCPVVVWFHGGGLTGGNKFIPEQLKESGLVVIAANYRLFPAATISDCIDDAAAAVAWAFREAVNYGGARNKIFVSGHSAGGYLTNMIGLDIRWLAAYSIHANSIAGLIPFSGQAISHFAYRQTKGMLATQPGIDEFAPLYHIRSSAPPLVIVSGDRNLELFGRYEETAYFWRMMQVAGHKNTYLYELDGYDHGAMVAPAFHILKTHIEQIVLNRSQYEQRF